jgi:hypothetical protein
LRVRKSIPLTCLCSMLSANFAQAGDQHVSTSEKPVAFAQKCPPLDRVALKKQLQITPKIRLVFFSTWCADCLDHLRGMAKNPKSNDLAIAVFDSQNKVESSLTKMKLIVPCAMDDGLASKLGVKIVPAEKIVTLIDLVAL